MARKTIVEVTLKAEIEVDANDLNSYGDAAKRVQKATDAAARELDAAVIHFTKTKTVKAD